MDLRKTVIIYLVAVINCTVIGFSFLGAKYSLMDGSPAEALFFRFSIAFGVCLLALAASEILKSKRKPGSKSKTGRVRRTPAFVSRPGILIPALLYSAGFFGFQFFALKYTSSIIAGIIMSVQPVLTMILAEIFIKEKPTLLQRACIFVAIASACMITALGTVVSGDLDFRGVALMLLSALSMSANVVFIRWKRGVYTPSELSFTSCLAGFVIYTAAALISGLSSGTLGHLLSLCGNSSFMLSVVYLGIACTWLSTFMNSYLMIYLEALKVSVFGSAGTIITLLAGHFILGESLSFVSLLLSLLILLAVIGTNINISRQDSGSAGDGKHNQEA